VPDYPESRRADLVEELHGVEVADPYRWLEDPTSAETRRWITAQNELSSAHLEAMPARKEIRDRLAELWDHPRQGAPWRRGDRWFQLRNDGLQDQDVLWTMDAPGDRGRVLLDPNGLAEDGTIALTRAAVRDDGALLAYGLSEAGSDWVTWRVRDVETGEDLDDVVRWSKFTSGAWLPDGSGFLYGYYEPPEDDERHTGTNRDQRLRLHRLGTPQDDDPVVIERPDQPDWSFEPHVTHDGRWLIVTVGRGTERETRIHAVRLRGDGSIDADPDVLGIIDEGDARYTPVGSDGDVLYVLTDLDAPRGRILSVDITDPNRDAWRDAVAEGEDTIERARLVAGHLVTVELHHARHRVWIRTLDGDPVDEVDLPGMATVETLTGRETDERIHLTVETFTRPPSVLGHDLSAGGTGILHEVELGADAPAASATQVFVTGADGTRIPLFLVHRAGLTADGEVPTLLWGYGGFDIPITPTFKPEWTAWVERGGLLAVACLRGGGEYGKEWHDAGRLENKQNVFDDLIACAEWLTDDGGWTRADCLAITGRSNGGLLVGAAMTQRPDLFGACVPEVGVLDMLRFHLFTIGWAWASDYGTADDPEEFERLLAYSPYHNVVEGTCYPPTLVTTGDTDDRVVPGHSFKFAAALQHAQVCDEPILIRIDTSAGHGLGKPTSKLVDERADVLGFITAHTAGEGAS
jgi:prolyl oligopeptidase